jgi:hypothetical protein
MGIGKATKYALRQTGKGIGKGYRGVDGVMNKVSDGGTWVANKGMKGLIKETEPTLFNAYTGLAPTKAATGIFAVGAGAYGTYATMKGEYTGKVTSGQNDFVGEAPIMTGDGVGNRSKAPTLGASGSMVFGLHNKR